MIDALERKYRKFWPIDPLMMGHIKLDAGCGVSVKNGFIGLDIYDYKQHIVWDLQDGVPLPDSSCIEIHCQHCLEHIPDMIGVMCEFWRVLKKDGKLTVLVPHKSDSSALIPTHVRLMDEGTFKFFEENVEANELRRHGPEKWKIEEMTVNHRNDLIVVMRPIK